MNQQLKNELLQIASGICDENATDGQLKRLETILDADPTAIQIYSDYMLTHAELFWHADSFLKPELSSVEKTKDFANADNRRSSMVMMGATLAAMLLLGSALGIGASYYFLNVQNSRTVELSPAQDNSDLEEVAKVTGTRNCRWSVSSDRSNEGRPLPIGFGSPIFAGQKIDLMQGFAEVTYKSGVRIIVEAPAKLDFSSQMESVLHEGRLTASVPPGAEGFTVACHGISLVDCGTEFGVNAVEEGETEVRVFDGLVEGHIVSADGSMFRKVSWTTNDSAVFNPVTNEFSDVKKPATFIRSMSQSVNSNKGLVLNEDFDYAVGRLGGQNGGFGFGGPWEDISFASNAPESNGVVAGSIPFFGIDHIGNHAQLSGQFNRIRRILGTSYSGVFDTAGLIEDQDGARLVGRDGTSVYLSFTQRISNTDEVFYGFELNRGDGNLNRVLCVGNGAAKAWNDGPPRSPDRRAGATGWSVTSEFNGENNALLELGDLGKETTKPVLIVIKLEFGKNNRDIVSVFVNPESFADENQCKPVVSGEGNFAFDRIGLANFDGDKSFEVDHIRVGTNFSAVVGSARMLETVSVKTESK